MTNTRRMLQRCIGLHIISYVGYTPECKKAIFYHCDEFPVVVAACDGCAVACDISLCCYTLQTYFLKLNQCCSNDEIETQEPPKQKLQLSTKTLLHLYQYCI